MNHGSYDDLSVLARDVLRWLQCVGRARRPIEISMELCPTQPENAVVAALEELRQARLIEQAPTVSVDGRSGQTYPAWRPSSAGRSAGAGSTRRMPRATAPAPTPPPPPPVPTMPMSDRERVLLILSQTPGLSSVEIRAKGKGQIYKGTNVAQMLLEMTSPNSLRPALVVRSPSAGTGHYSYHLTAAGECMAGHLLSGLDWAAAQDACRRQFVTRASDASETTLGAAAPVPGEEASAEAGPPRDLGSAGGSPEVAHETAQSVPPAEAAGHPDQPGWEVGHSITQHAPDEEVPVGGAEENAAAAPEHQEPGAATFWQGNSGGKTMDSRLRDAVREAIIRRELHAALGLSADNPTNIDVLAVMARKRIEDLEREHAFWRSRQQPSAPVVTLAAPQQVQVLLNQVPELAHLREDDIQHVAAAVLDAVAIRMHGRAHAMRHAASTGGTVDAAR